ncbi:DUF2812 domain-containing protein [Sporosarcina ureilytica]|uniref:DUF2812 domain-containing protein n=1 Tax=Sporosarcina ureilytica TaxID=298596 RepID=A0A1D8JGC0_9BACL|nr:DUF2812 domain-containing protein [Sporosarcina ureilytica]AOV07734.1 hypothetical protein BI350_09455 [Sporosarcina ureilytica]
MILRKWRPFWSYDIEKTERWLSEMTSKGNKLIEINRMTRLFSFTNGAHENIKYHIEYNKNKNQLPETLTNAGWSQAAIDGNWRILENGEKQISLYPTRDELVKRNRLHSNILTWISIYYGLQFIMPIMMLLHILFPGDTNINIESSPLWILTFLYFLQVIGVIILTIHMTRKLRTFERKHYDLEFDVQEPIGKTFSKWSPNWTAEPDVIEQWLEEMALKGQHLVKVQGVRFIFEKGAPKHTAYSIDFQWKTSPSYIEIHKNVGWSLLYASSQSFLKTAIWAKSFEEDETKPQLDYDMDGRRARNKKVLIAQGSSHLLLLLFTIFAMWIYLDSHTGMSLAFHNRLILGGIVVAIFIQIYRLTRTVLFSFK